MSEWKRYHQTPIRHRCNPHEAYLPDVLQDRESLPVKVVSCHCILTQIFSLVVDHVFRFEATITHHDAASFFILKNR